MGFELYPRVQNGVPNPNAMIRFDERRMVLNAVAREMVRVHGVHFELLIDRDARLIGMRPARTPNAYTLTISNTASKQAAISCTQLIRELQIPHGYETGLRPSDGLYLADLPAAVAPR